MMVEKINCFSVDGKGTLKMTDDDNAKAENFSCKFYGDFALENNPVSFQEAVKVYTMLPKLLGERGEHAVPVQIWLLPLTYLDSSATRVAHEISLGLVQETQTVLEELSGLQMQCNDLMNRNVTSHFPEIGTKVKDFKDMCLQYKSIFQTSLSEILPLIRGGGKGERELAEILKKKQQSLFNSNTLQKWLDSKEREIDILQIIIEVMKDTTMLTSEKAFDIEMFKSKAKYVVCFAFTSLNDKEPYLRHLSEYLKTLSGVNTVHTETERRQDAELPRWYFLKDVLDTMRRQVYLFVDFAEANKDSTNAQFLSTSVSGSGHKGGKIYLYKDSKKQTDNFEPPSKPGKLRAIERTHDSVTVELSPPKYGSSEVTEYLIEYCVDEEYEWKEIKTPKDNIICVVSGLLPNTEYKLRYKAVCCVGVSPTSEDSDKVKTLPTSPPGKPSTTDVDSHEIEISWTKPDVVGHGASIQGYIVEYRKKSPGPEEKDGKWKEKTCASDTCKITGLQPETAYEVRVRCNCGEHGQSKESLTASISTPQKMKRLAEKVKQMSECLSKGTPSVYKIPLQEIDINLKDCKRYAFGKRNRKEHRIIMVLGATGAGKSTLINGMINYILDVKWEDTFRFKLIDEGVSKSQAESQTSLVTAYDINYQDGYRINNSITIIDTPGFGDTKGIKRDRMITEQIRMFFNSEKGISEIDALCFVTQASLARLTHAQKYVFDAILSIFGKDIAENIQLLVTFADGQKPLVLEAVNVSGVPFPKTKHGLPVHFKFNNSTLFADNSISATPNSNNENEEDDADADTFDQMFWTMGMKSMKNFFSALTKLETRSLKLTREVIKERKQLETAIVGLQPEIHAGLAKLDEIRMTQQIIQKHETEIITNENYEFEIEVTKPVQKNIAESGEYITNCQQCFITCHFPCAIPDDNEKHACSAMDINGNCRVCSGKCHWSVHFNQKYKWEYAKVKEKRTSEDIKAKYETAHGAKLTAQQIIAKQQEEILQLQDEVLALIETSSQCLARLKEIALKPNPLSTPEYIDLLIESEKAEAKDGYLLRIQSLEAMRDQTLIISKVSKNESLIPDEMKEYNETLKRNESKPEKKGFSSFFSFS
ncbi:hypothetical protein Z043_123624 [Scleropages formosus]|uniref:Fibronectin type-III domain-containing protein n=1 Tax=Scleropages formosus TaxID=113540 RepID=A0A0P7W781_SCLFO|nr:hypothetical protein Z043_123624 [Scleropages formosus]